MKETQRIAILTDLFVGFRVGELLALEIADLDLERQTLRINKNLIRVRTEALSLDNPNIRILNYDPKKKTHLIVQSTPKTKTSNREIAISDGLCELLVRHLYTLAHSSWPNPDNLLFPSRAGTHIDPKSFEIRLNAISKRCEIKKVNPHALRHTLATDAAQHCSGDLGTLVHRDNKEVSSQERGHRTGGDHLHDGLPEWRAVQQRATAQRSEKKSEICRHPAAGFLAAGKNNSK